ncbi:cell division protein DivIVA [Jiangella anatolica]|uniref:Cell division protein DivIVA n=1 Tax=Jiangella anatolica TaxID=2670374 RepID=A0A2W2BYQ9_9ACTN|nr:cell division protein DivIVA [Jiangella anatolica]
MLFGAVLLVLGRGDLLRPEVVGGEPVPLPAGAVGADEIAEVRFSIVHRGYRMDQVDAVLDRLQRELAWRDHRLAELEARIPGSAAPLPRRRPGAPDEG